MNAIFASKFRLRLCRVRVEAGYTFYYGPEYQGKIPALSKKRGRAMSSIGRRQGSEHYMWNDESLGNSLKLLRKDWGHGIPDFDSIGVEATKSPVKGDALKQLMLAVWLESFGEEVPDEKGLADWTKKSRQKHKDLRARCFEWLRNGPKGVEKWNELRVDERSAVGKLG